MTVRMTMTFLILVWFCLGSSAQSGTDDSDGDGINDADDNCVSLANADQRDTDFDGFGNRCDADFNNDQIVNAADLGLLRADFFATGDLDTDLDGDSIVNTADLGILRTLFLQPLGLLEVVPDYYDRALRNPLKGFTAGTDGSHEWATLAHRYFKWNELENDESDGLDKILTVTNQKFGNAEAHNIKVIPRVYLHWSGDNEKYWPADMQTDDYDSPQFQARVTRLVERLGAAWNGDPRVAFVELGIFGKWGEHHSPDPTPAMQALVGEAFEAAFPDKLVSVRHVWEDFESFAFGEYWDSWAHQQQMWGHGGGTAMVNASSDRYLHTYIGGEVAYNWGSGDIQPGDTPTDSVSDPVHTNFIENSIRWLHCTQLRWIANYDQNSAQARAGAEVLQKAMGYRFVLDDVAVTPRLNNGILEFEAQVTNEGSAPFYYDWPVELALHDPDTRAVVWSATLDDVDVRGWSPGRGWTEPEWVPSNEWPSWVVAEGWSSTPQQWATAPAGHRFEAQVEVAIPDGEYVLSIAILDPASMQPSLRFATSQYWNGGRHPLSRVGVGSFAGGPLRPSTVFDDPMLDDTLSY
ncbi:MAG: DUF4832 domain-containing protein [Gammaproteobacteria bacterium]